MTNHKLTIKQLTEIEKEIGFLNESKMIEELVDKKIIIDYKHKESNIGTCLDHKIKKGFVNYIITKIESIAEHYAKQDLQKILHKAEFLNKTEKKNYLKNLKRQTIESLNTNFINQNKIDFYILVNSSTKSIYRYYKTGIAEALGFFSYESYLKDKYLIDLLNEQINNSTYKKDESIKELEFYEYITLESNESKKKLSNYIVNLNKNEKGIRIAYSIIALDKLSKLNHYTKTHLINSIKNAGCDKIRNPENILKYLRNDLIYKTNKESIDKYIQLINRYIQKENLY